MLIKVSDKGQLTIPASVLQQLGIHSGASLEVDACQGFLRLSVIRDQPAEMPVSSGRGLAGYSGARLAIEDMDLYDLR